MTDTAQWFALAIALLTGGLVRDIWSWLVGLRKGRAARRSELDVAWGKADEEARRRRLLEEHASRLTRQLIEAPCVDDALIPPFPTYSKEKP